MTSWRTPNASAPDDDDEWRFRALAEVDSVCERRLIEEFAPRFLTAASLPLARLDEVPDTIELTVADTWSPPDGSYILRFRSWYTGETRWLPEWDGQADSALEWMGYAAEDCGDWVHVERSLGATTPWDE